MLSFKLIVLGLCLGLDYGEKEKTSMILWPFGENFREEKKQIIFLLIIISNIYLFILSYRNSEINGFLSFSFIKVWSSLCLFK